MDKIQNAGHKGPSFFTTYVARKQIQRQSTQDSCQQHAACSPEIPTRTNWPLRMCEAVRGTGGGGGGALSAAWEELLLVKQYDEILWLCLGRYTRKYTHGVCWEQSVSSERGWPGKGRMRG